MTNTYADDEDDYEGSEEDNEEEDGAYYDIFYVIKPRIEEEGRKKYDRVTYNVIFNVYDEYIRQMAEIEIQDRFKQDLKENIFYTKEKYTNIDYFLLWREDDNQEEVYLGRMNLKQLLNPLINEGVKYFGTKRDKKD